MRASSLSDARVVELVSKYFVPVLYSRDHYQLESEPKALRDEIRRMDVDVAQRGLKGGNVCVFIMAPDGKVLATMPVQKANNPKNLVPFLEKLIEKEKFKPRKAEAVEASKAVAALAPHKPHTDGGLLLHVRTRHEGGRKWYGNGHDWVELTTDEWKKLLPAKKKPKEGDTVKVPAKVVDKLYIHFYPPAPNWKVQDGAVKPASSLTATVKSVSDKELRLSLSGTAAVSHPFGGKDDSPGRLNAKLVGLLRYDREKKKVTAFLLVSTEALYSWDWKGTPHPEKMAIAVDLEAAE